MPRTHDYEKLYAHIDALVEHNLEYQKQYADEYQREMGVGVFAWEFQTVGVTLPRRSGKTTYINLRATEEDVVVVASYELGRQLFRECKAKVLTARQLGESFKPEPVRRVYIDEPPLCDKLGKLISPFAGRAQQFICLGTPCA